MAEVMKAIPFTQFSMEMRSGKIIDIDDGFTELLGYTEDDFEAGIVFKQFVPSVEYEEVITELREKFIDKRYVSYVQEFVSKDGKPLKVVAFYKIENKLLAGLEHERRRAADAGHRPGADGKAETADAG